MAPGFGSADLFRMIGSFALVLALAVVLGLGGFMADLEVVGVGQGGSCFRGMRA